MSEQLKRKALDRAPCKCYTAMWNVIHIYGRAVYKIDDTTKADCGAAYERMIETLNACGECMP